MRRDSTSLFEQLGGRPTLARVHKIFYDKVYADSWLLQFFEHVDQEHIENQQTDFMTRCFGGPKNYFGRPPNTAHQHIFITQEMITARHALLRASLVEANIPVELADKWLEVDDSFTRAVIKRGMGDCVRRYKSDNILAFAAP